MYTVKTRYYAEHDQFGESYVVTSDNHKSNLLLQQGTKVKIIPSEDIDKINNIIETLLSVLDHEEPNSFSLAQGREAVSDLDSLINT